MGKVPPALWRGEFSRPFLQATNFFDESGGGESGNDGVDDDAAAGVHDLFGAYDLVEGIVTAFDEDIRFYGFDEFQRGVFIEDDDGVHHQEGSEEGGAGVLAIDGPLVAFEPAGGCIGVEANDEEVGFTCGIGERGDMSLMKDIKTSVCKGDGLAQQPPSAELVLQSGDIINFLRYDLRYLHARGFDNAVFC